MYSYIIAIPSFPATDQSRPAPSSSTHHTPLLDITSLASYSSQRTNVTTSPSTASAHYTRLTL
ncbi:hypothetical protein E2C01_030761 [Portunus trituberculatus]|uniref:Uncharacterized protein n=1 Tax=Portunus trituberculatus TaxID=210409 RepID=A0A5B7EVQ9_PORTR|nr:hypothetical protein [Portunus trituberculatus]